MTGFEEQNAMRERRRDLARFFGTWMRNPVKMGSVTPSSARYCATMVEAATTGIEGPILELGPGLGCVTRALVDAGVDQTRITSIEYDGDFARTLSKRFPAVNVVHGDGFDLDATLADGGATKFAAILFAIPILNHPQHWRQALFTRYFDRLLPGGNLTQLSYMWKSPVKAVPGLFDVSASERVWDNIPPARVWIYSRVDGARPLH